MLLVIVGNDLGKLPFIERRVANREDSRLDRDQSPSG